MPGYLGHASVGYRPRLFKLLSALVFCAAACASHPARAAATKSAQECNDELRKSRAAMAAVGMSLHDFVDACWRSAPGVPTPIVASKPAGDEKASAPPELAANKGAVEPSRPVTRSQTFRVSTHHARTRSRIKARHELAFVRKSFRSARRQTFPASRPKFAHVKRRSRIATTTAVELVVATSELGTISLRGSKRDVARGRFAAVCWSSGRDWPSICFDNPETTLGVSH